MNGYMLLQHIRAMPSEQGGDVLAIALTAYAGESYKRQTHQAGFQTHLAKPLDPNELCQAIAALLER